MLLTQRKQQKGKPDDLDTPHAHTTGIIHSQ
jgi:hypothetical protein